MYLGASTKEKKWSNWILEVKWTAINRDISWKKDKTKLSVANPNGMELNVIERGSVCAYAVETMPMATFGFVRI